MRVQRIVPKPPGGFFMIYFLSIEWNSIRLGSPAHEIVIKTTQNSAREWLGGRGSRGWWGGGGVSI